MNARPTRTLAALAALATLVVAALAIVALGFAQSHTPDRYVVEIEMPNHLAMGMNEQDVFIAKGDGDSVYRITPDDVDPNAALYASAVFAPHNPVDPSDIGPFPRGAELGVTQGEWLAGIGRATVRCDGDAGHVSARFEHLVPNGVYTLWYFFMAYPPTTPFATYDMPVGDRAGTQNIFVADADGNASLDVHVSPCLQLSGRQTLAGLAAAYHSDGATYGGIAGEFGTVAHLHVFNFLPSESEAAAAAN